MSSLFANFDEAQSHMKFQNHDEGKGCSSSATPFKELNTDGDFAAFFKTGNLASQEGALVILENEEDFKQERATEAAKEKKEINNKLIKNALVLKVVLILLVGLLLWNFVLVIIFMSSMSSSLSSEQAEKLEKTAENWKDAKTDISENSNLIRNLENKTDQLDLNARELQKKTGALLTKLAYGDFYSAKKLDLQFCGGAVTVSEMTLLRYSALSNSSSSPCAWLIWSTALTQIKMRLIDLEEGDMTIYQTFQVNGNWASSFNLTAGNLFQERSISTNMALLVYTPSSSSNSGNPDSGFEIGFTQGLSSSGSRVVSLMSDANPAVRKQLPSSGGYRDSERMFYIVYPPPGQKVNLTMESVDTETGPDVVTLFKFGNSSSPQNFQLVQAYSGVETIGQSFMGGQSQPFVLYFRTDGSVTRTGFRASIVTVQV